MRRAYLTGLLLLAFIIILGFGATAQGIPPGAVSPDGTLKLGPEIWLALIGAAITVGINLQLLRSLRTDVKAQGKKLTTLIEKTLPDEYVRRNYWKEKIDSIESTLRRLERRS